VWVVYVEKNRGKEFKIELVNVIIPPIDSWHPIVLQVSHLLALSLEYPKIWRERLQCWKIKKLRFLLFPHHKILMPNWIDAFTLVLLKSCRVTVFVQNSSVHTPSTIFFPSTFKNPKSANFWVKILIPNHCKS